MKKIISAMGLCLLSGCAVDNVERFNEQQADAKELAIVQAKEKLAAVPSWYLSPPQNDSLGIVGVGAASSSDLHYAVKKARLQAEFALAKNYRQELSGSERVYEREGASGELVQTSRFLIDKLVDSVPIVGYKMLEQEVKVDMNGKYQAYTLLKLPFDEFNKVLQSIKSDSFDAKEKMAFDDLERRLEAKRAQKELAADKEHKRKLELMKLQNKVIEIDVVEKPAAAPSKPKSQLEALKSVAFKKVGI